MSSSPSRLSKEQLNKAIETESAKFKDFYLWIENHMPASFFEEVDQEGIILIVHSLMDFNLNDFFSQIHSKQISFTLCLDSPDADLQILKTYQAQGIKSYRAFLSNVPPPFNLETAVGDGKLTPSPTAVSSFKNAKPMLRIAIILFTDQIEKTASSPLSPEKDKEILSHVQKLNPAVTQEEFQQLIQKLSPRFIKSLTNERLRLALDMFFRAKTRDTCQYEVRYNQEWKEKKETPSMQIVFAWRNVPKYNFLYHLAKVIHRHGLTMKRVTATYIDPYSTQNILIMSLGLHGSRGGAAWEEADIADLLKEIVTLKYFETLELIESTFVDSGLLSGNQGNLVKTITYFVHQVLVNADAHMYSLSHIEEGLIRHVELTIQLVKAFEAKFHPEKANLNEYEQLKLNFLKSVQELDTGNPSNDIRRKNILTQAFNCVDFTLKTNYFRNNKTALSFRLNPEYLDHVPYDRKEKFPELPYGIFFLKGLNFIGFHIRFRDLSRGGLRTVFPERLEQMIADRNNVFSECYHLAYTQNKKNKDIPEGGAKAVIFLEPYQKAPSEELIYSQELEEGGMAPDEIAKKIKQLQSEQKTESLYQSQRSFVESLLSLINCEPDGKLRAKHILDYWKKPEYIYLGPDENMHNSMIEWIAAYSIYRHYKPGGAFISSKPGAGIGHKEYGVTSLGVHVYMEEALKFIKIDPTQTPFTIKMTGGPDGDVAGNQIHNLYQYYPKTAKLLSLIDGSGTIFDPIGLDLKVMTDLFLKGQPISFYPPEKLNEGGFLLDTSKKQKQTAYANQTLCSRKIKGKVVKDWLSGNDMNHLLRHNVHQVKTDIFIPAGGRPRTLNENNCKDFLDETGKPTSRVIVEGANLYLTPWARRFLENLGVLIIKDSSANKGGVICSSFEVLFSLTLSNEEFLKEKKMIVSEILDIIRVKSRNEADLLLRTHAKTGAYLTEISEWISERINLYKDELLAHLQNETLSNDPKDPLLRTLYHYCPPLLQKKHFDKLLTNVPDIHKKAIIACAIASAVVYKKGLEWSPSFIDTLPVLLMDKELLS